jgi:molecular chaperone GrpE (heat shock protein)
MEESETYYTPREAERILTRSDKPLTERRIRQMLQGGELEGHQDDTGRWHVARHEIHRMLEERRESPSLSPTETSETVQDLRDLERSLGRLEGRLELSERAESTIREERDRLIRELEEERSERRRLQEELDEARKPWWRKLFQ